MSDFIPKPSGVKVGGLGRKAQKLLALQEKAAHAKNGSNPAAGAPSLSTQSKGAKVPTKKPSFQRKAV